MISATDAVLGILKDETAKDFDRKVEIEKVISAKIPSEDFSQLIALGKKITDYGHDEEAVEGEGNDEYGVAVVFDEEEQDSDAYEIGDLVRP